MGYRDEGTGTRRRKFSETAADIFMTFCGFCGVYLLTAHMLYQEISVWSMLPYLVGGVAAALLLPAIARQTVPDFLWKKSRKTERVEEEHDADGDAARRENRKKRIHGAWNKKERQKNGNEVRGGDLYDGETAVRRGASHGRKTENRRGIPYDRETAERRWRMFLTCVVCLVIFLWNAEDILRGVLVLADYIVYYFNYVFGTQGQFEVSLFFGKFAATLGSLSAASQLADAAREVNYNGVIVYLPGNAANCVTLFGAIAFYCALLRTEYGYRKAIVLADVIFGGLMLAGAFLVGAYEMSWMSLCLLLYLVCLLITCTMGADESEDGQGKERGKRPEKSSGNTHILSVYNAKTASFTAMLVFIVCIVLCATIFLVQKSNYFDSYETPWIVEKWEQAGDFVKGLTGGSGSISLKVEEEDTETGEAGADEEESTTVEGEEGATVVSWEPATGEGDGIAVEENLPSDDTVLGTLTLEDEMREATDTTYLKVLIDPSYYNSADTLYLKCYAGEIYEGDSWSAVTAEDIGVTDATFNAMNASLVVATYDLFSQYIRGTASDYLKTTLPGLFDIGASGKIWIRYMGESSVLFVPYYAISSFGDGERGDRTLKSGDDTLTYAYNVDELLPDSAGADADTVIDYNAIAADFGDAFAYGDGLSISYDSTYAEYENMYLSDKIYLDVPESLSRLREEFSEVEIDGKTYELENYGLHYGLNFGNLAYEAGLGDCIGYVINYLTANMTYSRSVAAVPEGADYIETFLLDRKTGYCSHYASAAVMMFRLMGIPARYAEGFAVDLDDAVRTTGGQYLVNVTGKSAHAWVEIYVSGVGWVPVNVTYGDDTTQEEETSEAQTTGDRETSAAETTTTPRTSEEESTTAGGTGDRDADGTAGESVFALLSDVLQSVGKFLSELLRALKTPLVLLLLFEALRIFVRLARAACLRWKCRGKSEEEKLLICAEDLNRYIDRHLHIKKRRTMAQSEVAEAEGDLFARADGKAGVSGSAANGRQTGWHLFRYRTLEADKPGSGRKAGRRRGPADVIVRMGARGGRALPAAEYEELLGLIRYAGKKTDAKERANLYLTMRKVKLVIYKESPWRRKVFF